jgi:hypothetical protein
MIVKAGQGGVRDRLDVAEPVLQAGAADVYRHLEASPSVVVHVNMGAWIVAGRARINVAYRC